MCPTATSAPPERRLQAGIVGGGRGAFIGSVHRLAAELDGQAQVVAGAMSSHAEIARASAAATASGCSTITIWPAAGIRTSSAPAMA